MDRAYKSYGGTYSKISPEFNKVGIALIDEHYKARIQKKLYTWTKIGELKNIIEKELGIPSTLQRLFLKNHEIVRNNFSLEYYAIETGAEIYVSRLSAENRTDIRIYDTFAGYSRDFDSVLLEIRKGFEIGLTPKLTDDGTSGTYFLQSTNRKNKGVFKPFDEEPYTPFNPRGYIGELYSQGIRKGILSGECASREVATFLLDSDKFHGVPPTTFVELSTRNGNEIYNNEASNLQKGELYHAYQNERRKTGSLQMFVDHDGVASDYGRNNFPVEEVHKVAILDIRILNCDRNEENILIKKVAMKNLNVSKPSVTYKLIPIDHGLSFPDCFDTADYEVVWVDWPQAKEPFTKKELEFIEKINPVEDVKFLFSKLKIRDICLRNFRVAEIVLKKAAKEGLTLHEIGKILYKEDDDIPAAITLIVKRAEEVSELIKPNIHRPLFYGESASSKKKFFKFNQKLSSSDSKGKKIIEAVVEDEQDSAKECKTAKYSLNDDVNPFSDDNFGLDLKRCQSSKSNRTRAYSENFSNEAPDSPYIIPHLPSKELLKTECKTIEEKTTNDTRSKNSKNENGFESIMLIPQPSFKSSNESARGVSEDVKGKIAKGAESFEEMKNENEIRKYSSNVKEPKQEENEEEGEMGSSEKATLLKRTISLPDLQKNILSSDTNSGKTPSKLLTKGESEQDTKKLSKKKEKSALKNNTQSFEKIEKALDQLFFYYFESFLDQHITLFNSEKKKPKNEFRKRYYSNEYHM